MTGKRKGPGKGRMQGAERSGFLERWSHLKRRGGEAEEPEGKAETSGPRAKGQAPATGAAPPSLHERQGKAPRETEDDAALLERLGLPEPESLGRGDIRAFLEAPISASLRRRALRQLWQLDPVFANLDGLLDYGEDYTGKGVVVGMVETAFRVGRGMIDREEEESEREAGAVPADARGAGEEPGSENTEDPARTTPPPREEAGDRQADDRGAGNGPSDAERPATSGEDQLSGSAAGTADTALAAPRFEAGRAAAEELSLPRPRRMRFRTLESPD